MNKIALITGVSGQDGGMLSLLLKDKGYRVYGMLRGQDNPRRKDVEKNLPFVSIVEGDLLDQGSLINIINKVHPDEIYNLGAISFVPISWQQPLLTAEVTGLGVLRLLESIRITDPTIKLFQASSSEQFGKVTEIPQTELTPFHPRSPYGVAKCFSPRTMIFTDKGMVPIKSIKVGDRVWSHDGQLHSVTRTMKRKYLGEFINIRVGNGINPLLRNCQISTTPEHPVYTSMGWKEAKDLTEKDTVIVVATRCQKCGSIMPFYQTYCSNSCALSGAWDNPDHRIKMTEIARQRLLKYDHLHSPQAKKNMIIGHGRYLREKGMSSQEIYLDYLIQSTAPGIFQFTGDGKEEVSGFFPDWISNNHKAIIEYSGVDYLNTVQELMKVKVKKYIDDGYQVLVLSGKDFKKPLKLKEQVAEFVSSLGSLEFVSMPITKINKYNRNSPKNSYVYNLEVEGSNSYIAGGIVVHNCTAFNYVRNYRESYGLFACSGISFNHEGPTRGSMFVTRKISKAVARIKLEKQSDLKLGNIEAKRDWGYSGDFVKAYWMMLQAKKPDDFVIATNETHTIREFCEEAFGLVDLDWQKYVKIDDSLIRPAEVDILQGDYSKIKNTLGWEPSIRFKDLVKLMVENDLKEESNV